MPQQVKKDSQEQKPELTAELERQKQEQENKAKEIENTIKLFNQFLSDNGLMLVAEHQIKIVKKQ